MRPHYFECTLCYTPALPFLSLVRGIAGGEEISRPQNPEIICRTKRGPILINHTNFTSAPKREGWREKNPFTSVFPTSQPAHVHSSDIQWLQKELLLTQFFLHTCRNSYRKGNKTEKDKHSVTIFRLSIPFNLKLLCNGCETWSLTITDERRLRVFENRVLRRVFGPKRDEVTGEWRKLHNEELDDLYSLPNIVRVVK